MPSHLSAVGFLVKSREDFSSLAIHVAKSGQMVKAPGHGSYRAWSPGEGIELWAQVTQQGQVIGLNPHFNGKAVMPVGLSKRILRPDDTELDGAFYGWAGAPEDDIEMGSYPFAFDVPNYRMNDALQLPQRANVQLAAFAHEIKCYENEEAFRATGNMMAVESCIPCGTFHPGEEEGVIDPPKSEVIYYGHVLETALLTNPFTLLPFYWARVTTLGGEIDLVADPETVKGTIIKNGVIGGLFWLSGRLK